ncbi:UDP-N-acetylglucosamine transporter [Oopsacas minuta]|uniref:UDP-N-acetylglucosamine transporter n=1 Tax=Oopsacas minuta TaxID=111878 RepID=A0AAV7JS38_9METZ|nr:UDP-N-acetylglucosamine transporter [Oopsacas minuta]
MKWVALFILFIGISFVQFDNFQQIATNENIDKSTNNPLIGFFAVLGATCLSGFVGVYVEKQLKGVSASLWVKNIQLSFFGAIVAAFYIAVKDGSDIFIKGFFFGYTPIVFVVVIIQAAGGILVAAVIKYADNIVKGFATSIALVVSLIASIFIFAYTPTIYFLCGLVMVGSATYIYSRPS